MKRKTKYIIAGSILGFITIGLVGASMYMYNFAFVPGDKAFLNHKPETDKLFKEGNNWLKNEKNIVEYNETTDDNLNLKAYYIPSDKKTNKTVVVVHGYGGKAADMAIYIKMFHDQGYNVLAPDLRGSGKSQGKYIGYGYPDSKDLNNWVKQLINKNGKDSQIGLFGVSMGGATVMMASGLKLPKQVKWIVEDCGYNSIEDELAYQLDSMFKLPKFPLIYTVNAVTQVKAKYNFFDGDADAALTKNKLPVLFIHGDADKFVPTKMVYKNYDATKGYKELYITHNTAHADSYKNYPEKYYQTVDKFIKRHGFTN